MSLTVQSEVGQLRQVIVHRPGLELSRLTPQNISDRSRTDRPNRMHTIKAVMVATLGPRP